MDPTLQFGEQFSRRGERRGGKGEREGGFKLHYTQKRGGAGEREKDL